MWIGCWDEKSKSHLSKLNRLWVSWIRILMEGCRSLSFLMHLRKYYWRKATSSITRMFSRTHISIMLRIQTTGERTSNMQIWVQTMCKITSRILLISTTTLPICPTWGARLHTAPIRLRGTEDHNDVIRIILSYSSLILCHFCLANMLLKTSSTWLLLCIAADTLYLISLKSR